ncbi:hypothetical protein C7B77_12345 [Chamaesiphon polymorphus CCALA 037]|uniref:Uncharacterized protein n=1 Tax=Chamaesiphon polymorphus CCALA 037 TaxID=2107692 RepID=A0A2T1GFA2_9CYAN|nr:hypothetical protein C7B77_12345 [Chamaesiphon polymorphus CCALA 037]
MLPCRFANATLRERPVSRYSELAAVKISPIGGFAIVASILRVRRSVCLFPIGNFHAIVNELLRIA